MNNQSINDFERENSSTEEEWKALEKTTIEHVLPPKDEDDLDAIWREIGEGENILEPESGTEFDPQDLEIFSQNKLDFGIMEKLISQAKNNRELKKQLEDRVASDIGRSLAEKFLSDEKYRYNLQEAQKILESNFSKDVPAFISETHLKNLAAIYESFGHNILEIANTFNLDKYPEAKKGLNRKSSEPLTVLDVEYDDLGLKKARINLEHAWNEIDDSGKHTGNSANFSKIFKTERDETDSTKMSREVYYQLLELPSSLKANGLGAKILTDALHTYDNLKDPIEKIKLEADIDVGAYAWANFGFGWDVNELKKRFKTKDEGEAIKNVIYQMKDNFLSVLSEAGIEVVNGSKHESILKLFKKYEENPLAVTPQMLAGLGKEGPYFRKDENGLWHTEEEFDELKKTKGLNEHTNHKGRFHAGKAGFIAFSPAKWDGEISLKKDSAQRKTYEKTLEKRG